MRICKHWMLSIPALVVAAGLAAGSASAEPITFQVKFPAGEVDNQTNTVEMDQSISGEFLPAPKSQSMKMVAKTTLKPIKSDASGSVVELTYDSMKLSGSTVQTAEDEMDKTLSAFLGKKITLHYTPAGKVDKVEGVDAILAKLPPGAGQVIKALLNEDRIKDEFNSGVQQLLPDKPVSVGDSWKTEITHQIGKTAVKIKSDVTLKSIENRDGHKIAKLEFTGKGDFDTSGLPGAARLSFDNLDQTGTAEFDLTRGWLTSQVVDQTMKGNMQLHLGDKTVKMNLDQSIKAKTIMAPAASK